MKLSSVFRHPAYLYNPRQIVQRLKHAMRAPAELANVRLPWGWELEVNPNEFVGRAIATQGIHEINVCEAVARLVHPGDLAVDAGANVGFITNLLARVVGDQGTVFAFEPHPQLFALLSRNVERLARHCSTRIFVEAAALSDKSGNGYLRVDRGKFSRNSGTATLGNSDNGNECEEFAVPLRRLDEYIGNRAIRLLKIDVEGAELAVLKGAESSLRAGRIENVVYEDFHAETSGITAYLEDLGFSVFHLDGNILGPCLTEVDKNYRQLPSGRDENFLATLNQREVLTSYCGYGWRVFRF